MKGSVLQLNRYNQIKFFKADIAHHAGCELKLKLHFQLKVTEPVLKCFVCDAEIPFRSIREHTETHNTGGSNKV